MSAVIVRTAAQRLRDASADQGKAIDALAHFLTNEIAKSDARLAPCVCGHVAMFCACGEELK